MTTAGPFFIALACYAAAGAAALARSRTMDDLGEVLAVIGSVFGVSAALVPLRESAAVRLISLPWQVPGGSVELAIDPLSGAFLLVVFVISGLGAIHGHAYWSRTDHPESTTSLRLFYALMTIGLALVLAARNSLLFLVAWELMALSAFFLVATEDGVEEVRRAAWTYLVATHIGTLCLFAAFAVLRLESGSLLLAAGLAPTPRLSLVFLLALLGFGLKAGLVPLHFWLPAAHSNAPSHVSALMSGVMLKAGIYGILRVTSLVTVPPVWWSFVLATLAAATAVTGIALALAQTEIKRALAFSSVENMGIVCLGIALALAGRSAGVPVWVALGLGGAVTHVWSHSTFKPLLFFASGGILHSTHSRSMDRMGGLLRRMPVTGSAFVIGALAASGLPPLNGFVGEWLIALGFFHAIRSGLAGGWFLAFAAPALALAGALALASFLRIVAVVFLGTPRTAEANEARESSRFMLAPLLFLASICLLLGLLPGLLSGPLSAVIFTWSGYRGFELSAFLIQPYKAFAAVVLLVGASAGFLAFLARRKRSVVTWDCGYAEPAARMQYTASSTGEWFSRRLLVRSLRPSAIEPGDDQMRSLFPPGAAFRSDAPDPFSSRLYEPLVAKCKSRFEQLRWLQQGRLTLYLVYIFLMTLGGVAWAALRGYLK